MRGEKAPVCDDGRVMSEGVKTVILGKPNAGKSSLMNVLLGEERPLLPKLRELPGYLEEHIYLQESVLMWWIRRNQDTEDVVEKIGVDRAMKAARTLI